MTDETPEHRQFLRCSFRPGDKRAYTYHNDGPPVGAGQQVKLPDRSGDGWTRGTVVDIGVDRPEFPTKAILGLAPDQDEPDPEKLF